MHGEAHRGLSARRARADCGERASRRRRREGPAEEGGRSGEGTSAAKVPILRAMAGDRGRTQRWRQVCARETTQAAGGRGAQTWSGDTGARGKPGCGRGRCRLPAAHPGSRGHYFEGWPLRRASPAGPSPASRDDGCPLGPHPQPPEAVTGRGRGGWRPSYGCRAGFHSLSPYFTRSTALPSPGCLIQVRAHP